MIPRFRGKAGYVYRSKKGNARGNFLDGNVGLTTGSFYTGHMENGLIRERRLIHLFREVGHNLRSLGEELRDDASEAAASNDPIKFVMAPIAGAARVILKGPTSVLLGVFDKPLEKHTGFETGHAIKETAKDIATLHPIRAFIHAINIPDSLFLDGIRGIGGFTGTTRSRIAQTLKRETQHSMAA